MTKTLRKTLVTVAVAVVCVGIAVLIESGALSRMKIDMGGMLFGALIIGGPVLHALIAHPKKMPFYWVFINLFGSLVGYAFFLFFLLNRDKLSKSNQKYNQESVVDAKDAQHN
ncbi:hypothetical protein [Aliikangiella maris]|uniref:Uncharacterized protein n=1 Tax=Aliikangiella maris TaxID=3162458 RepID=A0ABV3MQI7_9GAMM